MADVPTSQHTVFGKLVGGEDVLAAMEAAPTKPGTDKPAKQIKITEIVMSVFLSHPRSSGEHSTEPNDAF